MALCAWISALGLCVWAFSGLLEKQTNPNQYVQSSVSGQQVEVRLKRNRQGHYVAKGKINGETVTFLVDTGATNVSIPAHLANKLSVSPQGYGISSTANGDVEIAFTTINTLQLGDIQLNQVSASINPGMQDDKILLGMSVLSQLEFTQKQDWLILRTF
ncbi:TIGR02281 family clan AA aspartic protease [Alteromonas sp. 5E99-2]|uniref:retropepsin-like aspartic protease family protein n=1 Tax=Alteromonas sp. 5E99-2 TaxID=2817683 RepID=UPI001F610B37|nr:TIGR02281 family clan AA aspartic protease [Alteromonas sp. 5E99-2]